MHISNFSNFDIRLIYDQHMHCKFNLDLASHMKMRINDMFSPYIVPWDDMTFANSLAMVKALHPGNAMKVIKTWLNGWHTSSRCQAARIYPCLFGCEGKRDDLHHYIICPQLYGLCKFLKRGIYHFLLDRICLCNPTYESCFSHLLCFWSLQLFN